MGDSTGTSLQDLFNQCWDDDSVMERFLADPAAMLFEHNVMDVRGMDVEIAEHKANNIHLIFHCESPDKIHLVSRRHPRITDITP